MSDLIDRQAAIDEVVNWLKDRMTDVKNGKPLTDRLKDLPSAQPEHKTGKWKHMGGDEWCCDQCGNVIHTEGSWEHPLSDERKMYHCNICGARMVQEGEDNERA